MGMIARIDGPAPVLARLADLLQLEHDALPAYTLAIHALRDPDRREAARAWRADHERHAAELTALIRDLGGIAVPLPHLPTGLFKLAVQAIGAAGGGDRAVLLAFKANELQAREKYARMAASETLPEAAAVLERAAADEARHYAWAESELERLGAGSGTPMGIANNAFAAFHSALADMVEGVGRAGLELMLRGMQGTMRR
ncbi:ferritin family protein [Arenibaculum pallidiluteum]|uniref:ferritin-like domain-containing protein n=1 Tax=Arenibaculum pallidiluteum TaxID=2812559 RepID=UPI001A97AB57|nr:ferritin-like domain-containing protein [Arenibaculum pallidiluteum]